MTDIFEMTGKKIKELREQKGISQRELARRMKRSNGYISALERGDKTANIKILNEIATALNVDVADFFENEHKTKTENGWAIYQKELEQEGITLEQVKKWVKIGHAFDKEE